MSFVRLGKPASCNTIRTFRRAISRRQPCLLHNGPHIFFNNHVRYVSCTQHRGAKSKTVIRAADLPQGQLPALPPDPADTPPAKTLPLIIQQHLSNVRKFPDCVVLTRVGDFYELYGEQVEQYAHLVSLKKAKRTTAVGDVAMAGFQYMQLEKYLKMFVQDLGLQVAISEQIRLSDEERTSTQLYTRKVNRVVTAGTLIDEGFVDPYENNYLVGVYIDGDSAAVSSGKTSSNEHEKYKRDTKTGVTWVDLSSGDFYTQPSNLASLPSLIARIGPREVVLDDCLADAEQSHLQKLLGDGDYTIHFHESSKMVQSVSDWSSMLERPVPGTQWDKFTGHEIAAGNLMLDYVRDKLQDTNLQLQPPIRRSDDEHMAIDKQSLRGLEIRTTLRDGLFQGSLLHAIRRTTTKSGARLLSRRLVSPSLSLSVIKNRLDLVQEMLAWDGLQEEVVALLRLTSDTLRLLQRFSIGKGDADDLLSLARTIDVMGRLFDVLSSHAMKQQGANGNNSTDLEFLTEILRRLDLDEPIKLAKAINTAIDEEGLNRQHSAEMEQREEASEMAEEVETADTAGESVPRLARRAAKTKATPVVSNGTEDIWIMRRSASTTLERAHVDLERLLEARDSLVIRLRKELKADSLTLKWSASLGHFCHLKGRDARNSLSALHGARSVGTKKTTQSFYYSDWTHLGTRIEDAKLRIRKEEERVLGKLRAHVLENLMILRRNATVLDELDIACSSAILAKERNLVRPVLDSTTSHTIINGRHPTVDVSLHEQGRTFTANNCAVGEKENIQLITGPNMAGKSTYLRQNALFTILAQTGCFISADYARIGLVDKVFSRVGSADNLYQDQSTFMVEMLETAEILKQATPRSFVIMDEVGRGTTPEDGIAVGYACLHHLHYVNKCRALFATHFHVLAEMTEEFEGLGCWCTDVVEEEGGEWAYVHRLRRGVNRESHALKVARLAGMPEGVIDVAERVIKERAAAVNL